MNSIPTLVVGKQISISLTTILATIDGEPCFVGKDVAEALGYSDTKQAIRTNVSEEDKKHLLKSEFRGCESTTSKINNNGAMVINESGLYALIFGSKLESAKRFKHWEK